MKVSLHRVDLRIVLLVPLCALMGGCVSTLSTMTPGKMEWVQPDSTAPRAGEVYLVRGLIGLFSGGIDALTVKIDDAGVRAHVFQEDQRQLLAQTLVERYRNAPDHEPIILIGHSLGADAVIDAARELDKVGVTVDVVVTIDPTRPANLPKNVKVCYNYYQPSIFDGTGILRGIPLTPDPDFHGQLYNMNIRGDYSYLLEWDTNHVNIDKNTKIHADIIAKLAAICPTREVWAAAHMPILAGSTTRPNLPRVAPVATPAPANPQLGDATGANGAPRFSVSPDDGR